MRIKLIFIFSILYLGLKSQGIEPTSIQASQYKKGILQAITPYYDEFTGDTLYQYAHLDSSIIGGATISGVYPRIPYFRTASSFGHSDSLRWDTLNGALILRDIPIGSNADRQLYAGSGAGSGAVNATDSNFFGTDAGSGATDAGSSNFFGYSAGYNATNANGSNFFGNGAGYGATNAARCNLYGSGSGYGATDISDSNFFGSAAGSLATDATGSNFFGANAGNGADNASYSNLLGYGVGQTFTGNNIGSNNIIIGTNISLPDAAANAINLGGILFGTGTQSSLSGDPKITATAGGKIGIMTVTPTQELHVTGNTRITGAIYDSNNEAGTSGQVLSSTVTGTDWINASGGIDSTVISAGYGVDVTESPVNTYTIKADTAEVATPYDLTLKQNKLSGTVGYFPAYNSTSTLSGTSLLFSNGSSVGIGTTSPISGNIAHFDGGVFFQRNSYPQGIQTIYNSSGLGAGITFDDTGTGEDYLYYHGTNKTFMLGTTGSSTANKKLHVHGGMTIGDGYATTAVNSNSLNVEGNITSNKAYTNTSDVNIIAGGNIPMIGWNKPSSYRFALGSSYLSPDRLSLLGASSTSSNPSTVIADFWNTGQTDFKYSVDVAGNFRTGTGGGSEFSFNNGSSANPADVTAFFNINSSKRFRIQAQASLSYMDFYTLASGSNRNFSFATSFTNAGDFHLLRSTTAGGTPATTVWAANSTGFGVNTGSPSRQFDVNGDARVQGAIYNSGNSSGTSGQVLTSAGSGPFIWTTPATGTVTGTGTSGYMSYWNGTTSQAASTISYGTSFGDTGIGFGLTPANVLGNIDFASGKYMNFRFGSYINTQSTGGGSYSAGSSKQILAKSDANNSMIWRSLGTVNGSHLMDGNITVGTIGGSGTTNYVPKFTSSINLGNSLLYDDNTNMGINTTAPTQKLDINGTLRVRSITGTATSIVGRTSDGTISAVGYGNGLGFSSGVLYVLDQNYAHAAQDFSNLSISTSPTALPLAVDSQGGTGISTNTTTDEISVSATISAEVQFSVECKCNTAGKKVTMYLWHSPSNAIYLESRQYFNNTNEYANWNMFRRVTLAAGGYSLKVITDSGTADLQDCKVRFQIVKI